ncbi:MAG: response regulator [Phycisphaerae bacterium]
MNQDRHARGNRRNPLARTEEYSQTNRRSLDSMYVFEHEMSVFWSRRRILLTILITIFVVEIGAMFLLPVLLPSGISPWIEILGDATLLSMGSLPLLWFLLIRPMYAAHRKSSHRAGMLMKALDAHALVSIADVRGRITYANEHICKISQYGRDELIGRDHRILNSGHHPKSFMKGMWDTIRRGEVWRGDFKNRAKDGSFYWVQATIVPFTDEYGKIEQYVAIRADITELKRVEDQIKEYNKELEARHREISAINANLTEACRKAEEATRAKSEFLANMSHEIRTPMTAILGYADMLRDEGDITLAPPQRVEAIETIHRNGENLLGIINDILDLSKIETGKMTVENIPCVPSQVVDAVKEIMKVRADAKGLALHAESVGAIPETILSDPTRLRQCLINLIGNAIKFTEQGAVRLITRFVPDEANPQMQFDILDTGAGMTREQIVNIFLPFTQADTSTTRKFGGTGLGLTISKRFAEMLGGDITIVESQEGVGTRFRLTVATGPLEGVKMIEDPNRSETRAVAPEKKKAPAGQRRLDGCRILLAEDGPDNQRLIAHILRKAGAEIEVEANGKLACEAVTAARDGRGGTPGFDVILMDMQMPVMDGYEAARRLRGEGYSGPIIALTAHAMAGDRQKCIDAGCDDYMTKPVDRTKLIETIRKHVQKPELAVV